MESVKIDQRIQAVLYGLVCHLDNVLADFAKLRGPDVEPDTHEMDAHIYLRRMGEVGFYEPLTLRMERQTRGTDAAEPLARIQSKNGDLNEVITFSKDFLPWFENDRVVYVNARLWPDGLLQLHQKLGDLQW
jgi:hypothetical protein